MTIHSLGYSSAGTGAALGLPQADADEIADLVLEAERLAYGRIDMGDREAGPSARTRIRVKFEEILDRCGDSVERTDLMVRTCKAIIAGAIHPDAPLGMIGSLSVRLACLHYLAE